VDWLRLALAVVFLACFVALLALLFFLENEWERKRPGWP
jgi:hypothetical protein